MPSPRRGRSRSRGQALAEFAIVFPVFILMLGGTIQFGIIFWAQNTLTQVARDTGRYAATQLECTPETEADIKETAGSIAEKSSLIGYPSPEWRVDVRFSDAADCPPTNNGDVQWVTIGIAHKVPIFFPWIPGSGRISTETRFRMEPYAE